MTTDAEGADDVPVRRRVPLQISLAGLLAWTVPLGLLAGGLGAWPTYRWAGSEGVLAMMAAGVICVLVVVFSAMFVCWFALRGPAAAAGMFVMTGLIRMVVCMALAAAAWGVFRLPGRVLFVWCGVFYGLMVLCEAGWMARAMARDAQRTYLGEIRRDGPFGPSASSAPSPLATISSA